MKIFYITTYDHIIKQISSVEIYLNKTRKKNTKNYGKNLLFSPKYDGLVKLMRKYTIE